MKRGSRAAGLALLVVLSGCATVTVDSRVRADGTISTYEVTAEMPENAYQQLNDRAQQNGYENVGEQLKDDLNESRYNSISTDTARSGSNVTLTMTVNGYDPGPDSRINVTRTNETVVYRDSLNAEMDLSDATVMYTVRMPGPITETNADRVGDDNRTAHWTFEPGETQTGRVVAESETRGGLLGAVPNIGLDDIGAVGSLLVLISYVVYMRSDRFDDFAAS